MSQPTYIKVPASTADRLATLGRSMLELAQEMKQKTGARTWVKPKSIPKDREWFWSEEWQEGEREADEALAKGKLNIIQDNIEEK